MAHIYFFNELKLGCFFLSQWVRGHNNHSQNERCDALAVMALQTSLNYVNDELKNYPTA